MKSKNDLMEFIEKKLNGEISMTYEEIANATGYHPKYILRFKKNLLAGKINEEHGNKGRKPITALSKEEEKKIVELYKRSNASVRKFAMFYSRRSYSCIYNVLKRNGLI